MNEVARTTIIELFCSKNKINAAHLTDGLKDVIYAASTPYLLMIECLDHLDHSDPANGFLIRLAQRTYNMISASLSLLSLNHLRGSEVLSRTIYEGSMIIDYVARENSQQRMMQYFVDYIDQEKNQNRQWKKEAELIPPEILHDHFQRIDAKNNTLENYYEVLKQAAEHFCKFELGSIGKWPKLIDRLDAYGRKIEHRTIYAAMCSQSHGDAEDVLNEFYFSCITDEEAALHRLAQETDTFSVFLTLCGIKAFLESIHQLGAKFSFPTVSQETSVSISAIDKELAHVSSFLNNGGFPNNWASTQ